MNKLIAASLICLSAISCGGKQHSSNDAQPDAAPASDTSAIVADEANSASATHLDLTNVTLPELPAINEAFTRNALEKLASDEFEGRAPATKGGKRTIAYVERAMKNMGLEPANGESYRQSVPLVEITADLRQSAMTLNRADGSSISLRPGMDTVFWTKRVVEEVSVEDSDLVFVGYGIVAPEYGWNDYEGIDVTGKTVVMLVNDPGFTTEDPDKFNGKAMTYYGRWTYKYEEAARQGAAAAIVIHQTEPASYGWGVVSGSWSGPQLDLKRPDNGASRVAIEAWVSEAMATKMFDMAGMDFDQAQKDALKEDFKAMPMTGLSISGNLLNTINESDSANVAGMIKGSKRPDEYVLFMAHWDHLGRNFSSSGDNISNGAVDNATGTAGLLAIARSMTAASTPPERSVLFVAVTAEESGLLGSAYFAEDPLVPLKSIVGGINMDAFLPTGKAKDLIVVGYGASQLEDILKAAADKRGLYLRPDVKPEAGYFYRSDHISLAKKGVPMLYADSGIDLVEGGEEAGKAFAEDYTKNRYHKPSDEYSADWDMSGLVQTLEILEEVGATMAWSDISPNWYEGNEFRALRDAQLAE
ncbi:MAG: M28 family metallopeptidase [bacterium]